MSHVIGQGTIASNHYRTTEYRASQYTELNAESTRTFESPATAAQRRALIKKVKDLLKPMFKNYKGLNKNILKFKNMSDEQLDELIDKLMDADNFDELIGDGVNKKQWLGNLLKGKVDPKQLHTIASSLGGKSLYAGKKLDKVGVDAATTGAKKALTATEWARTNPIKSRLIAGSIVIVGGSAGLAVWMGFGGNEALQKWMDQITGNDCGKKAEDQNLEGDEYSKAVEVCQRSSLDSLFKLGLAAVAVVGFVGLVAVTRAVPKRKAKVEDSEDEE